MIAEVENKRMKNICKGREHNKQMYIEWKEEIEKKNEMKNCKLWKISYPSVFIREWSIALDGSQVRVSNHINYDCWIIEKNYCEIFLVKEEIIFIEPNSFSGEFEIIFS